MCLKKKLKALCLEREMSSEAEVALKHVSCISAHVSVLFSLRCKFVTTIQAKLILLDLTSLALTCSYQYLDHHRTVPRAARSLFCASKQVNLIGPQ